MSNQITRVTSKNKVILHTTVEELQNTLWNQARGVRLTQLLEYMPGQIGEFFEELGKANPSIIKEAVTTWNQKLPIIKVTESLSVPGGYDVVLNIN